SLPQELKKITQQLTALPLTFIVVPALNYVPISQSGVKSGKRVFTTRNLCLPLHSRYKTIR
ncbi:hypothetical protein, partial [uncultured Muribaculum sp.]